MLICCWTYGTVVCFLGFLLFQYFQYDDGAKETSQFHNFTPIIFITFSSAGLGFRTFEK